MILTRRMVYTVSWSFPDPYILKPQSLWNGRACLVPIKAELWINHVKLHSSTIVCYTIFHSTPALALWVENVDSFRNDRIEIEFPFQSGMFFRFHVKLWEGIITPRGPWYFFENGLPLSKVPGAFVHLTSPSEAWHEAWDENREQLQF